MQKRHLEIARPRMFSGSCFRSFVFAHTSFRPINRFIASRLYVYIVIEVRRAAFHGPRRKAVAASAYSIVKL